MGTVLGHMGIAFNAWKRSCLWAARGFPLARGRPSVLGVVKWKRPASSRVGLRPPAPHRVAPVLLHPPPRASPFTKYSDVSHVASTMARLGVSV
jgi:hypothetical protein